MLRIPSCHWWIPTKIFFGCFFQEIFGDGYPESVDDWPFVHLTNTKNTSKIRESSPQTDLTTTELKGYPRWTWR